MEEEEMVRGMLMFLRLDDAPDRGSGAGNGSAGSVLATPPDWLLNEHGLLPTRDDMAYVGQAATVHGIGPQTPEVADSQAKKLAALNTAVQAKVFRRFWWHVHQVAAMDLCELLLSDNDCGGKVFPGADPVCYADHEIDNTTSDGKKQKEDGEEKPKSQVIADSLRSSRRQLLTVCVLLARSLLRLLVRHRACTLLTEQAKSVLMMSCCS